MRDLVENASGKKLYVCLRCGHQFWSRAKKPQCGLCKSKRVIPYEEFLKLPEEERNRILGRKEEKKNEAKETPEQVSSGVNEEVHPENPAERQEAPKEENNVVSNPVTEKKYPVKRREEPAKVKGLWEKKSAKITQEERVKKGDEIEGDVVKKKAGFKVPVPRLSWKVWGFILGLAFLYYLYKVGWFDSMLDHLKFLKTSSEAVKGYEERRSPVLGKIESNLRG